MTSELWAKVRQLVEAAAALPSQERLAFLNSHAPDKEVLEAAQELLSFEADANRIFTVSPKNWSFDALAPEVSLAGKLFGHYRLIEELGRGGMGAVYLAERADGAYQQRVAVKVLQENIFTPRLAERFTEERQNLARLSDPGIARLLDGGVSFDGRPYLVLEYVDGLPIDVFCDERGLDTRERLQLFLKVAATVQAAHQMLVLHLDLKPANILVTPHGEPRLLDFGISRVLGESHPNLDRIESTLRLLTPRYASPEQAAGKPLGVASDVFSLTTLLFRLLTGRLPYDIENASPLEAGRIILEEPPLLPSKAADANTAPALRGDLDTILLQGLRKEPGRRYPTVAALAEDIQRHLDSRAVLAHADSLGYRARKFARRHRPAVLAASLVLLILAGSAVAITRFAIVAERQRLIAERADTADKRHLKDMRALAHSYVFDLDPKLEQVPGTNPIRIFVLNNAEKYLAQMSQNSVDDDDLARETAQGYNQIAQVQDTPGIPSLSDPDGAEDSFNRGIAVQQRLVNKHPGDLKEVGQLMRLMRHRAEVPQSLGDIARQQKLNLEAWQAGTPLLADPSLTRYLDMAGIAEAIAFSYIGAPDLWNFSDPSAALPWFDQASEITREYKAAHPTQTTNPAIFACLERDALGRAWIAVQSGHPAEARPFFEEAVSESNRTDGEYIEQAIVRDLIKGYFASYLLAMHEAGKAESVAPKPAADWNAPRRDPSLVGNDADATALLARIDLEQGRLAAGRLKMRQSLDALETIHKLTPKDADISSELAWDNLRLAQENVLDAPTRKRLFERSLAVAQAYFTGHPEMLSAALVMAQSHLGLAALAKGAHDRTSQTSELQSARESIHRVLAVHPGHVQANELLRQADAFTP